MMFCSSVVSDGKVVYGIAGRGGGAIAVRPGEDDDVVWQEQNRTRFSTPVLYEGHLYSISGNQAVCINAETGETVSQTRLSSGGPAGPGRQPGGGRGFGGGRGGGGRDYTSPILAGDKLIYINGSGQGFVITASPDLEVIAENRFESDDSSYVATPAASDGELFIRSNTTLYCVAE
jgi:hypothetical protein